MVERGVCCRSAQSNPARLRNTRTGVGNGGLVVEQFLIVKFDEDRGVIINGAPGEWLTNQILQLQAARWDHRRAGAHSLHRNAAAM